MKKIIITSLLLSAIVCTGFGQGRMRPYRSGPPVYHAQEQKSDGQFDINRMYAGGSLGLGFGTGQFAIGANPEMGYSLTNWFDLGVMFNLNYNSYSADYYGYGEHAFNYGAGVYGRLYPVNFLFIQLQPEINWIHYSFNGTGVPPNSSYTTNAASFIGGIGYVQRIVGQSSFYLMLGVDLLRNPGSPYLDGYNNPLPILRGGFNIYFHSPGRR